jgi:antitoxin VapB
MTKAKVFTSGNSQAVRLPKEFRFSSAEVEIAERKPPEVLARFESLAEIRVGSSGEGRASCREVLRL